MACCSHRRCSRIALLTEVKICKEMCSCVSQLQPVVRSTLCLFQLDPPKGVCHFSPGSVAGSLCVLPGQRVMKNNRLPTLACSSLTLTLLAAVFHPPPLSRTHRVARAAAPTTCRPTCDGCGGVLYSGVGYAATAVGPPDGPHRARTASHLDSFSRLFPLRSPRALFVVTEAHVADKLVCSSAF